MEIVMPTKEDVLGLGQAIGGIGTALSERKKRLDEIDKQLALIDQFKSTVGGIPNIQEQSLGATAPMSIPNLVGPNIQVPEMPMTLNRDTGQKDWAKALGRPDVQSLMSTGAGSKMFLDFLSAQSKVQDLTKDEGYTLGQGQVRYSGKNRPVAYGMPETDKESGQPTQLAKMQRELAYLKSTGAPQNQISQYETFIKNYTEGRPSYSAVETSGGEVAPFDVRKGTIGKGTGVYKDDSDTIKLSYKWIGDNLDSMDKVKSMSNVFDKNTGFVTGSYKRIASKGLNDPEFQQLRTRLGQLRTIIYGFSGKQINEQEAKWLQEEILPQLDNPKDNFEVKMNELDGWLKNLKSSYERVFPGLSKSGSRTNGNSIKTNQGEYTIEEVQ